MHAFVCVCVCVWTVTHKFTVAFQRRWVYAVASKNVNSDKKPGKKKVTQIAVGTSVFTKSTVCFANQPCKIYACHNGGSQFNVCQWTWTHCLNQRLFSYLCVLTKNCDHDSSLQGWKCVASKLIKNPVCSSIAFCAFKVSKALGTEGIPDIPTPRKKPSSSSYGGSFPVQEGSK